MTRHFDPTPAAIALASPRPPLALASSNDEGVDLGVVISGLLIPFMVASGVIACAAVFWGVHLLAAWIGMSSYPEAVRWAALALGLVAGIVAGGGSSAALVMATLRFRGWKKSRKAV